MNSGNLPIMVPFIVASIVGASANSDIEKLSDGIVVPVEQGRLRIQAYTPDIIRVRYVLENGNLNPESLAVIAKPGKTKWNVEQSGTSVIFKTSAVKVRIERKTGQVAFERTDGSTILKEGPVRSLKPTTVMGLKTLESRQSFHLATNEAIYGLGQHQEGRMNYVGSRVHLQQENRIIAVPMLVSSKGYGLLWDNPAVTDVDVASGEEKVVPSSLLSDKDGNPGGLTGEYYKGPNFEKLVLTRKDATIDFDWTNTPPPGLEHDKYSVRWTGYITVPKTGEYVFVPGADDGLRLFIDDKLVSEDWNSRAYQTVPAKVQLNAGQKHKIRFEFFQNIYDSRVRLCLQSAPKTPYVTWTSESADAVDYVFFNGPSIEKVIAGYRSITGQAPMFPRWFFGLWQSRERYKSQDELLDVVSKYRSAGIPLDGIIQDWQYWPYGAWGSHTFDASRFPDPAGLIKQLHKDSIHTLISIWPKFDVGTENSKELIAAGGLFPKVIPYVYPAGQGQWYDPFSAGGRTTYWNQISRTLAKCGWDGWWLDGSEAEFSGNWGEFRDFKTGMGYGMSVFNAYPLMHTKAVYEGQRAEKPKQRSIILTRSAYAGQQRNAAISWSGDIQATWQVLARQIPAGLNFCMSGIPYWNTDTGGFWGVPPVTDEGYADLFTRWFQYSVFCPMLRIHGTDNPKEIWRWSEKTQKVLRDFDELRYHLLPYIYSYAWQVTANGSTMMRGLPMDFPNDPNVNSIPDQFLFGREMMACPVTTPGAKSRKVYLPKGASWIDFWTGELYKGGQTVNSDTVDKLPLFVRAGSILPYGPSVQNAEQPEDPTEIRIYPGANGTFTLYNDKGDGYEYEQGQYATVDLKWNNKERVLVIGARKGSYPEMPEKRTFRIVVVGSGKGVGISSAAHVDKTVEYRGQELQVKL